MSIAQQGLWEVLRLFNAESHDGVKIFEFFDGQRVMPATNAEGSYLTKSVCFLHLEGADQLQTQSLPYNSGEVSDLGNGWKFLCVEIPLGMTTAELYEALEAGTRKLLAAKGVSA